MDNITQQRLTTIYLVLKALGEDKGFEINYSTRLKSGVFLKNIKKEESSDNIDFFHMYNAYSTIVDWIKDPEKNIEAFRSALLNRVNFIWYEVDQKEEIKVFQRLNIGKIPLTDSELIKALFLNRTNFCTKNEKYDKEIESLQKTIAFEWDMIERDLQNDEFWAFINNFDYPKQTRIDYILDTILTNFNEGASIIISTHLISDIERILDEVIFIDQGEIKLISDADELRNKENASIDEIFRRMFKC